MSSTQIVQSHPTYDSREYANAAMHASSPTVTELAGDFHNNATLLVLPEMNNSQESSNNHKDNHQDKKGASPFDTAQMNKNGISVRTPDKETKGAVVQPTGEEKSELYDGVHIPLPPVNKTSWPQQPSNDVFRHVCSSTKDTKLLAQDGPRRRTALRICEILESYRVLTDGCGSEWDGFKELQAKVERQVAKTQSIRMILPGFPFKSPNSKDQVLGAMPDLGEEMALAHLDGLCRNISAVYEYGAEIHICSDGLAYNDLLGVPDETVWEYDQALRQMARRNDLQSIKFLRLWDLLDHPSRKIDNGTEGKAYFVAHASCIRRELVYRYGVSGSDFADTENSTTDNAVTLDGHTRSLVEDLATRYESEKIVIIAKAMITREKAFAKALAISQPGLIRLSIHNSSGKDKLPISLLPQEKGSVGKTPWRSCLSVELDGSYRTVIPSDVRDTHCLVSKDGQPSFFRAKSVLFDWNGPDLEVDFEHLYPCGLIIRPHHTKLPGCGSSITFIPMEKVRLLSHNFSPIVLRGFTGTSKEKLYVEKAHEMGKVLVWPLTGMILKVRNTGEVDKMSNNVTSNEPMPMHFDGIFKFEDRVDPETGEITRVLNPPGYQFFTCLATAPKGSGYTLFCNSRLFFRYLPSPWSTERLEHITWDMINDGFWSAKQTGLNLVLRHPTTNAPCLRWHQPWDSSRTKFSTYVVTIENDEQSLVKVISTLIYDHRVCLRFEWEQGDLLVNDNVAMLHTRTEYSSNSDREMWRIHLD